MNFANACLTLVFLAVCLPLPSLAGNQETADHIARSLRDSEKLRGYRVSVRFQAGTASLRGTMGSRNEIEAAVQIAGRVPGVQKVVSELEVGPQPEGSIQMVPWGKVDVKPTEMRAEPFGEIGKGTVKVAFLRPVGATLVRTTHKPDVFDSRPVTCPTMCALADGTTYRMKIGNLANHPGLELFATLELKSVNAQTKAFVAENAIPVFFAKDVVTHAIAGKSVTIVDHLREGSESGVVETITSTRISPETDAITEANRRGTILAIVHISRTPHTAKDPK